MAFIYSSLGKHSLAFSLPIGASDKEAISYIIFNFVYSDGSLSNLIILSK